MSQQPYYPPQQPQYPQQPGVQQFVQPQAPAQPYANPGYPQQGGYPQQPPAAPPVQLANGGLDEFYSQPNTGGGPGVSWKGKPDGYTVQGIVPRDVGDGDVQQEVGAPNTAQAGQPQFYRDGRPKFVMTVPLQVPPSQEFPEGEARLFVRGQLKDELSRAMAEAGVPEKAPVAGATITVTLVQRKQGRGAIPQNIFAVRYTPAGQQAPQAQQQQQQINLQQGQAPIYQQAPQYAQGGQVPGAPSPAPEAPSQPVQQQAPQGGPQAPAGLSPDQQALLAQLQGQQG